jgi:hypothetical protein
VVFKKFTMRVREMLNLNLLHEIQLLINKSLYIENQISIQNLLKGLKDSNLLKSNVTDESLFLLESDAVNFTNNITLGMNKNNLAIVLYLRLISLRLI